MALILVVLAALTDLFDGLLARSMHLQTPTGEKLDPIADKILLISVFAGLLIAALIPAWYAAIVFGRDIFLLIGSGVVLRVKPGANLRPSLAGKLSTVFQILLAADVLGAHAARNASVATFAASLLLWASAFATAVSGIDYAVRGVRQIASR